MAQIEAMINKYFGVFHIIGWEDIAEILIISFFVYEIIVWIKRTKAWSLLKGVLVILIFISIATLFKMNTILYIVKNVSSIAVIGIVIVLQPELRRALEQLGKKNILSTLVSFEGNKNYTERFSDTTLNEIVKASVEMGKVKTGALIVIENKDTLSEYSHTGIEIDAAISSQLLINIFEHNTPLHDGAIIIRGNRIIAATCYLPLSDNTQLSKDLGTRHRAGIGISENTDSLTIIVSEESGKISVAYDGKIERNLTGDLLRDKMKISQNKNYEEKKSKIWKGKGKYEKKINK